MIEEGEPAPDRGVFVSAERFKQIQASLDSLDVYRGLDSLRQARIDNLQSYVRHLEESLDACQGRNVEWEGLNAAREKLLEDQREQLGPSLFDRARDVAAGVGIGSLVCLSR